MRLVPLDGAPQSFLKASPGPELETLFGPGHIQCPARLTVRLRAVPHYFSLKSRFSRDHCDKLGDSDFLARPKIHRLPPLVFLRGQHPPFLPILHTTEPPLRPAPTPPPPMP